MAQQQLERALSGAVPQPLKRRPRQRRSGEPLVLEHQVLRDQQPAAGGELTQPDGLALNRLVLALALGRHSRRRSPRPCCRRRSRRSSIAPFVAGQSAPVGHHESVRLRQPALAPITDELDLNARCHRVARGRDRDSNLAACATVAFSVTSVYQPGPPHAPFRTCSSDRREPRGPAPVAAAVCEGLQVS